MNQPDIDWKHLPFGYYPTDYNVRCTFRDGKWGEIEVSQSDKIDLHMAATTLHYGQEIFEGLKAFRGKDGKIRIFRLEDNAERMRSSAEGILMEPIPVELFREMCIKAVQLNERFIPPYGSGASLYIRPLEIGLTPSIGVRAASEYLFIVMVTPVGPYFKTGFGCTDICIMRQYDRVAPRGTGRFKIGGNYAASLVAGEKAHQLGYGVMLYLDPKEKKYLDECGAANFYGVKGNTYVTPASETILPSITNKSLRQIARDMGMNVEERHILYDELKDFDEVGACGTAAVCSPIGEIVDIDNGTKFEYGMDTVGPVTQKLYDTIRGIQNGEIEDKHGWTEIIEFD